MLQRTGGGGALQRGRQQAQGASSSSINCSPPAATNHSGKPSDLTTCPSTPSPFLPISLNSSSSSSTTTMFLFRSAIFGVLLLVGIWKCLGASFLQQQERHNNNNKNRRVFSLVDTTNRRTKTSTSTTTTTTTPPATATAGSSSSAVTAIVAASMTKNDINQNLDHHIYTAADLTPRYTGPSSDQMTSEQRTIRDAILASRPRTGLAGPFGPWLAVPAIARPAQELGRAVRYGTSLSFAESELVILLTAAKTRSHAEFDIHVGEAYAAGLSNELIAAIPRDGAFSRGAVEQQMLSRPQLFGVAPINNKNNDRMRAIARFAAELLDTCTVSDDTYRTTKAILNGEDAALVEITSIVGYYTYVAYTLNVFQIPSK